MIDKSRVRILNDKPVKQGGYVLYWMQQSQRVRFNAAFTAAAMKANELKQPLVVGFGLMDNYPEATERHYAFMLEGLADVKRQLDAMGVAFVILHGTPADVALKLGRDASVIVTDKAYLRHLRAWRERVADEAACRVVEIESDVVVPVEVASDKAEFAARTLRPRIHKHWNAFLQPHTEVLPKESSLKLKIKSDFDLDDVDAVLKIIGCDRAVKKSSHYTGGPEEAQKKLKAFIAGKLGNYAEGRNEPAGDQSSHLSPYLQYGHISPVEMSLAALKGKQAAKETGNADVDSFIEELIVRRELAHNYCYFTPNYDQYDSLPAWARRSLEQHASDPREFVYSRDELAAGKTHDPYWNAAMLESVKTGYMHNYMRMYWGKKILEWTPDPKEAFETTLYLNNRFFLDGLNANSYGNVGWIFGAHDRPWGPERKIFGLIRYMNDKGLERKFDIDRYVAKVAGL